MNTELMTIDELENALRESERKYRHLFETMHDGVYKSSHDGKFIDVNPALVKMLGYSSKEELMAIDIKTQLYFESSERENAIQQDLDEGVSIFRLKKKDGSEIWVEDHGNYTYDDRGKVIYHEGILRDVTRRVEMERRLKESMKETADYQLALDQSLIVSATDLHGIIRFANQNLCKISGYKKDELIGRSHKILNSGFHPKEYMEKLWTTILAGGIWRGELRDKKKNGEIFWIDSTIVPFKDDNGKPYMFLAIAVDITEQKKMMDELSDKYSEVQKINSELDSFVYSVTHDLRAPLSSMMGVLEIATEENTDPSVADHLALLSGSAKKLDGFITDILDYSKNSRSEVTLEPVDFTELTESITSELKYMGEGYVLPLFNVKITDSKEFIGDRLRLKIILSNLISNAIRYQNKMATKPEVNISINVDHLKCTICVKDNGIGISKENQKKIFKMFYRVSTQSAGSGLGLYIVKEAIDKLNGRISVESAPGAGTLFVVEIPNQK
ncbi:MAG: PAS domain-containing sensor histidine kinase [Bacteroidia bacterium]